MIEATTKRSTDIDEAMANVAAINDPELKKLAFEAELRRLTDLRKRWERPFGWAVSILGALSVMVGIWLSVASFADTRQKDAETRQKDADSRAKEAEARLREDATRRQELLQPGLELRRRRYLDILSTLGKIAAYEQDPKTLVEAKRRFWELYWADLSLVEDDDVKTAMEELGGMLDSNLQSTFQQATYKFAGLIRQRIVNLDAEAKK
jgi:hypothetical protein